MNIFWIDSDSELKTLLQDMLGCERYAMDTEFHRERTYFPQLALIQIKHNKKIFLIDPIAVDLALFTEIFASDSLCVLHAAQQDLEVLNHACGSAPRHIFDTQIAAGFIGMSTPSLSSLVLSELKISISKGDRLTDWLRRPLTADQKTYAATDVEHLLDIQDNLEKRLKELDRLSWVHEACEELRVRPTGPADPSDAWLRVKEARALKGQARGVAQAVCEWRERKAMAADVPPRRILSDIAILGIAQIMPTTSDELLEARGVENRQIGGEVGRELLVAVERGKGVVVSLPQIENDDVDKELRPAVALITAWMSELARTHHIDATLLGTRNDILSLLRKSPQGRLSVGWRAEMVGKDIERILSGEAGLSFNGHGRLRLLPTNNSTI
jgi:ribonuclease D